MQAGLLFLLLCRWQSPHLWFLSHVGCLPQASRELLSSSIWPVGCFLQKAGHSPPHPIGEERSGTFRPKTPYGRLMIRSIFWCLFHSPVAPVEMSWLDPARFRKPLAAVAAASILGEPLKAIQLLDQRKRQQEGQGAPLGPMVMDEKLGKSSGQRAQWSNNSKLHQSCARRLDWKSGMGQLSPVLVGLCQSFMWVLVRTIQNLIPQEMCLIQAKYTNEFRKLRQVTGSQCWTAVWLVQMAHSSNDQRYVSQCFPFQWPQMVLGWGIRD